MKGRPMLYFVSLQNDETSQQTVVSVTQQATGNSQTMGRALMPFLALTNMSLVGRYQRNNVPLGGTPSQVLS